MRNTTSRIIKQLKAFAKVHNFDKSYDPYKAAYASMPASAASNHEVKQQYVNGHFCYVYKSLFEDFAFQKAFIPLKVKLSMDNVDYTFNENGIPCCPHDPTLPMKCEGSKSHLKSKLPTMKFVCPKMKWEYNKADKSKRRVCHCDNPCTTSCGRMIYVYPEKNLRAYPGVERGSKEWDETYKIRVNVEKSIKHFNDSFCVANRNALS